MMTRTARSRFRFPVAAIAAVALVGALSGVLLSPVAAQQPPPPPAEPAKPAGLSAVASHDRVVLTWGDPGDDSITGYVILRRVRENDVGGEFSVLVADTGTAATTYTDDTVVAETTYTYRIKAINDHGVSERSRWFHIDIPAAPERPAKPAGLSATASHDRVVLTWGDPGDDSITGYVILRRVRENDVGGEFSVLVADTGTAATTYTDDTVVAETTYTYRIKAINDHGVSRRSRWFHIDTPAAPQAVEDDDQDEQDEQHGDTQGGDDDPAGAPGEATPPGSGDGANVSEGADDLPHDNSTRGRVAVGGSVTGNLDRALDLDWFAVDLEATKTYRFDLEGEPTGRGTLEDPFLRLWDGSGTSVTDDDDDSGTDLNSRITHTPTTGTYYLEASAFGFDTGTYTLSVTDVTPEPPGDPAHKSVDPPIADIAADEMVPLSLLVLVSRPDRHDGTPFTVDLEFSEPIVDSDSHVRDDAFSVTGGTITGATRRNPQEESGGTVASQWRLTVEPSGSSDDVVLEAPGGRPCDEPGALCTSDGRSLAGSLNITIAAAEAQESPQTEPAHAADDSDHSTAYGPVDVPGRVRNVSVPGTGQARVVYWDAPDESKGAQWITNFRIWSSTGAGCDGIPLAEYVVSHPGFATPPDLDDNDDDTELDRFKYFKIVYVASDDGTDTVQFGVSAVNDIGEGPCADE